MTVAQLHNLGLAFYSEFEVRDNASSKPGCFRKLRFVRFAKKPGEFYADWMTRHLPDEDYRKESWANNGLFDCRDLSLIGEVAPPPSTLTRRTLRTS